MIAMHCDADYSRYGTLEEYTLPYDLGDTLRQHFLQDDPRALLRGPDGPVTIEVTAHPRLLRQLGHKHLRSECVDSFRHVFPHYQGPSSVRICADRSVSHRRLHLAVAGV